jgi:tetratricopeptide (TPR) repeat protein
MQYRGLTNVPFLRLKAVLLPVLFLFSLIIPFTALPSYADDDEVRKLIKQSVKLTRRNELKEAETVLRRALEMDANRSDAKVELAWVLTKQRRIDEAYNIVFPIAKAEPRNARAFSVLGATLLSAGRFKEARRIFYNALVLDKKEHLAWAGYGMLDFYENNIDQSLENLTEAVFRNSDEPDYVFALAQVSARAERYRESADNYERFLRISSIADKERRARIRGLINFLRFLGQNNGLYLSQGSDQASVPFELVGNRPIIKLRVNEKSEDLRFVLDTGSGITVVSEETAKRLKIKPITKGGFARGIGGDGKFEIVYGLLREVKIGDVELNNVPVYIRKFHSDGGKPVDGYIGLALISKFLTTIDYGSQTFSLTKKEADTRGFREGKEISLPLRLTSSGFLSGEVELEGIDGPLNFIVDTGASVSVISQRVAQVDAVSKFENDEKYRVIGSAGISDDVRTFLLPRVTFGQHTRTSIMAVALNLDLINEASGFEQSGILGGNFLKNYRLTFDFKNSKVTFSSVRTEND